MFFVSVASKGVRFGVSRLFAPLTGKSICVASKGVMGMDCWRESNGLGWEEFGGVRRTTWLAPIGGRHEGSVPKRQENYSISVQYVNDYL